MFKVEVTVSTEKGELFKREIDKIPNAWDAAIEVVAAAREVALLFPKVALSSIGSDAMEAILEKEAQAAGESAKRGFGRFFKTGEEKEKD